MELEDYTRRHPQIVAADLPPLLGEAGRRRPVGRLIDLGAGDGTLMWALRGWFDEGVGVDLSTGRIERMRQLLPEVRTVVADAAATGLPSASADFIMCSQLIEHVDDDRAVAAEIRRLLAEDGRFYVGTVLRRRHAFWIYRRDGRWWLDPTHQREYVSAEQLTAVLSGAGLRVEQVRVSPCHFPIFDMALRGAAGLGVLSYDKVGAFYAKRRRSAWVRRVGFQPPGYFLLEAVGTA